ncbi:Probable plastid-lipid-associated protein 13, chloroplastic [Linum perenne]
MDVVIKEGKAKATANMKLLYSIESKFTLSSQLTVEGPLRMKEEYVEGFLETPKVIEETLPEQLKGALGQAINTMQQLPVPIRDVIASGLRVPLAGTFQRLFLISYLDEEILIMRDAAGVPEVLTRMETPATIPDTVPEYES